MEAAPQTLMYFGALSPVQLILFLGLAVVLFGGKGKVSDFMGDVAKGIKSFKRGLADDDEPPHPASVPPVAVKPIENDPLRAEAKSQTGAETKV